MSEAWINEMKQLDAWTLIELICLCMGVAPEDLPNSNEPQMASVIKAIKRAVSSGALMPNMLSSGEEQEFDPVGATIWAKKKYPSFPFRARVITTQTQEVLKDAISIQETTTFPKDTSGILISLPHMTQRLEAVFNIMRENWQDYDRDRVPKQTNIMAQINKALGYAENSREGQTLAALIRPDELRDADNRVVKKNHNKI